MMPVINQCLHCKAQFLSKPSDNKKFCSRDCYGKWRATHQYGQDNPAYKPKIERFCLHCGKTFEVPPSHLKHATGTFDTVECYSAWRKQKSEQTKVDITCVICKKVKRISRWRYEHGKDKTCSKTCEGILKSQSRKGKANPNFIKGESNKPYCIKFNKTFRQNVRDFFGNICIYCGKTKEGNNGKNMHVHHVTYQKGVCCEGDDINGRLFVTLCNEHHPMTNSPSKREYWKKHFTDIIINKYNGKCYYDTEKYNKMCYEKKIGTPE